MKLLFLSKGKLYFKDEDNAPKQIHSSFANEVLDRALRMRHKNSWKTKGSGPFHGSQLWGVNDANMDNAILIKITATTFLKNKNRIIYAVETEAVGGVFLYDVSNEEEQRIFHKENFIVRDFHLRNDSGSIICSRHYTDGSSHIALLNENNIDVEEITDGDSIDESPSWVPGESQEIVYQSAGIARNENGYYMGMGPFSIQKLNLKHGELFTILEDSDYDFLSPRMNTKGELLCIRRPYEPLGRPFYSLRTFLTDVFMFPFRLCSAFFHFLNSFSLFFSKKPLTTATGPKINGPDQQKILIRGRLIDVEKALRESGKESDSPAIVPGSWTLMKYSPDNEEEILAKHVLAYDIMDDDSIIYTNGKAIFHLNSDGKKSIILKNDLIEHVVLA